MSGPAQNPPSTRQQPSPVAAPSISQATGLQGTVSASGILSAGRLTHASTRLHDIQALKDDGSNFGPWKHRIVTVLQLRGLLGIVRGDDKYPEDAESVVQSEWMSRDQDARAQITLALSDEPLNSVILEETAYDVWQTLCGHYEGTGQQTIAQVIGELLRNTLTDDSPMQPQLAIMRQKAQLI